MVFWSRMHILTLFLDMIAVLGVTNGDKNLEIIILRQNENHLHRVLREHGEHDNTARPHQGLGQHFPVSRPGSNPAGPFVDEISWACLDFLFV